MRLLDFLIPDFLRIAWVSLGARDHWQPRLRAVQTAWKIVEWESVAGGLRACAILEVESADLPQFSAELSAKSLFTLPLVRVASSAGVYRSTVVPAREGTAFAYRIAIGRPDELARFSRAWQAHDDDAIGALLGYPPCCREFFRHTWVEMGLRDTTWAMAGGRTGSDESRRVIDVEGRLEANVLARFIGVRAVPHLPCRFDCEKTVAFGQALMRSARELGFIREMDDLSGILSWSYEWSALHGVAEVRAPVLKVAAATDSTADCCVVRLHGTIFPEHGATGSRFPYASPGGLPINPRLIPQSAQRRTEQEDEC